MSVPPLVEQERIVNLLDEADELRKLRVQAGNRTAALVPALFHEMFGDPMLNPCRWHVQPLGNLATNHDSRRVPLKKADRAKRQGSYPYYGATGIIDSIDDFRFEGTFLLVAEDGMNLVTRSKPIAFTATGKFWVNNHAHIVSAKECIHLCYLRELLNLIDIRDYVTGIDQMKLTRENLDRIPTLVPPFSLQERFAQRVSEIRKLQTAQAASRHRLKDLFQSLLHRAFNGDL
jgi:type I restriction enzyme S subunit